MNLGTEKIEAIVTDLKELVIIAKKVKEDGKVDLADLPVVISLLPKIPGYIADFKAIGEVVEEGKDIDVSEVIVLIQKISAAVKEIEKA